MLQTGHIDGRASTIDWLTDSLEMEPKMPVLIGEVGYEGMLESNREEFQRFFFWSSMLSGAMGFTYGANGIWQINRRGKPFGPSPHGNDWGDLPWDDAYLLPGSTQVAMGKNLLERYPWWEFERIQNGWSRTTPGRIVLSRMLRAYPGRSVWSTYRSHGVVMCDCGIWRLALNTAVISSIRNRAQKATGATLRRMLMATSRYNVLRYGGIGFWCWSVADSVLRR